MTMDIDSPKAEEELSVFVHPLALIHMSDQYTRIRCGGSPLPPKTPVEGILFGNSHTPSSFYVQDAGDIPLADAATQIELHQAVFAKQSVLGWYKVVDAAASASYEYEPTATDLKQTQQVQSLYQKIKHADESSDENDTQLPTFFGVLQVPKPKKKAGTKKKEGKLNPAEKTEDEAEEQGDDELPLTLYQLDPSNGGKSLVAMATWSLQTAESERIAVQRVIREKAPVATETTATDKAASSDDTNAKEAKGGKGKNKKQSSSVATPAEPPMPVEHTVVLPYVDEVAESCQAIANRLTNILQYLEQLSADPNNADPQVHLPLLRQVQGLLLQLGPIAASAPRERQASAEDSMSSLQKLAKLSQTVEAVTLYAEKFKFVQEHTTSSGRAARDLRRF